jgi:para-aminobenzoate synthetase / 4-amino-4-deoxychorismate lyase
MKSSLVDCAVWASSQQYLGFTATERACSVTSFDLRTAPFVLLDDSRAPHEAGGSLLFHSPEYIITAENFAEIPAALEALDAAYAVGLHCAGWISYEVAAAFEPRLATRLIRKAKEPLIWMMATKHCEPLSAADLESVFHSNQRGNQRRAEMAIAKQTPVNRTAYLEAIDRIQSYISAGDVYQINHTFPLDLDLAGDPLALYRRLRANQPVAYGAYIDTGGMKILSLSPELFIEKQGDRLRAKPMKGTAPRGKTLREDKQARASLQADEKSRAENLMIVDLIRNDLSRISAPGSVKVDALFATETYPTLLQMTSTISAVAKPGLTPSSLLAAMFPCGSITGAPKIRAMEIIQDLEAGPRGIYCGTIGHFSPSKRRTKKGEDQTSKQGNDRWTLNVPIRTLCLPQKGKGRLNIGSGIVADSNPEAEYNECLLKARFAAAQHTDFALIETIRLENGHFLCLEQHLQRLQDSAEYFNFKLEKIKVAHCLEDHAQALESGSASRCRLLLDKMGHISVTSTPLPRAEYYGSQGFEALVSQETDVTVTLHPDFVPSNDVFLRHKTTVRTHFNKAFKLAQKAGHLDAIFLNERGHVTEGAISNIFIYKEGLIITPPESDGLLPGILRAEILKNLDATQIKERSLTVGDLRSADRIIIGNAVRGLRLVRLA